MGHPPARSGAERHPNALHHRLTEPIPGRRGHLRQGDRRGLQIQGHDEIHQACLLENVNNQTDTVDGTDLGFQARKRETLRENLEEIAEARGELGG